MIPDFSIGPLHFSCYWNLDGEWNAAAPEGMRIWAENLRKFEKGRQEEQYTWYGKLSFGELGIPDDIDGLNRRIQEQHEAKSETRLYLYTFYEYNGMKVPYSLHVAKVMELRDHSVYEDPKEQDHIPKEFYESMRKGHQKLRDRWDRGAAIPFLFKISDLRELNISDAQRLQKATQKTEYKFEQFKWYDTMSPAYVGEIPPLPNWFDGKTQWWKEVLNTGDDLDPGKFRADAVKKVYCQALQYAAINHPILIVGERGTGKTHLASFIRRNSRYCGKKYSEDWPRIACGDYADGARLESKIFSEDNLLYGETLVLDDIEHVPSFLVRKILNEFQQRARYESSTDSSPHAFRLIGCTSLPPGDLHARLDPRFLDATAAILELPPLREFEPKDLGTVWSHQYEQTKKQLFPNENIPEMTAEEKEEFLESLYRHSLPGNFRDLKRLAARILLELIFRETISDPEKRPDLKAAEIFKILRSPQSNAITDQERAETLAWSFLNDRPIEDSFEIVDFQGLHDLVLNITIKLSSYLGRNVRRLAQSGHESAWKIIDQKGPTISKWVNEVTYKTKKGGGPQDWGE